MYVIANINGILNMIGLTIVIELFNCSIIYTTQHLFYITMIL